MVVNQRPGLTSFGGPTIWIDSIAQLPPVIISNLKPLMKKFMGDFYPNVHFVYGQVIDLVKNDYVPKGGSKISPWIPKYDLEFILDDMSIGIKSLPINIRFDENGKPLKFTWPRTGYTNKSRFVSRDSVQVFALRIADTLKFNKENCEVVLEYDENKQKFLWRFLFPISEPTDNAANFNSIEINWADINDYKISKLTRSSVN
jgi:hypothetical protein